MLRSLLVRESGPFLRVVRLSRNFSDKKSTLSVNEFYKNKEEHFSKTGIGSQRALEMIRESILSLKDPHLVLQEPKFESWVRCLESTFGDRSTGSVKASLTGIRDLEYLGLARSFAVKNLENNLIWRCRTMSMSELIFVLTFARSKVKDLKSESHQSIDLEDAELEPQSDEEIKLLNEVVRTIERRWTEISLPEHLITLIHCSASLQKSTNEKIDDRISELSQDLKPRDLLNVLVALGVTKRRSLTVLKNLAYHLKKDTLELDGKEACNGLFALSSLTFPDKDLIHKLCTVIRDNHEEIGINSLASCIVSLGRLRYRHERLLNCVSDEYAKNLDAVSDKNLHSFLMTAAVLNYKPENSESYKDVMNYIRNKFSSHENYSSQISSLKKDLYWLDIVWCLSVLGYVNHQHLNSVLAEDFLNNILYSNTGSNVGGILKLLNINAVAQHLIHDYKGSTIDLSAYPLLRDVNLSSSSKNGFPALCRDIFTNFAAPPMHSCLSVNTGMGFFIEAEAVFNVKNLRPLDISKYGFFQEAVSIDERIIPEGAKRVAVLSASFFDCNLDGTLGGILNLQVKLLESLGFNVLIMNYDDYAKTPKKTDKVKLTEGLLKKLIQR